MEACLKSIYLGINYLVVLRFSGYKAGLYGSCALPTLVVANSVPHTVTAHDCTKFLRRKVLLEL